MDAERNVYERISQKNLKGKIGNTFMLDVKVPTEER